MPRAATMPKGLRADRVIGPNFRPYQPFGQSYAGGSRHRYGYRYGFGLPYGGFYGSPYYPDEPHATSDSGTVMIEPPIDDRIDPAEQLPFQANPSPYPLIANFRRGCDSEDVTVAARRGDGLRRVTIVRC